MRSCFRATLLALVIACAGTVVVATDAQATANAPTYYLSLGDSLAAGYQPDGTVGEGFADQFFTTYGTDSQVQATAMKNMAVNDETTCSFSGCASGDPAASQLAQATQFIKTHQVNLVSVSLGANDLLGLVGACQLKVACIAARWSAAETALISAYDALFSALTGIRPSLRIVMFSLYNPFADVLEDSDYLLKALNHDLATTAAKYSAKNYRLWVADAFGAINGPTSGAAESSALDTLTWIGQHDVHPRTAGYARLAGALKDALPHS
jgi:lysophospholipase L1-like esterase